MSIEKTNKNSYSNPIEILTDMLFNKKIRVFSSQLIIYKKPPMLYNNSAAGNRRQVPFVAHCEARFCEMSSL